jgi:hypothetical protein
VFIRSKGIKADWAWVSCAVSFLQLIYLVISFFFFQLQVQPDNDVPYFHIILYIDFLFE